MSLGKTLFFVIMGSMIGGIITYAVFVDPNVSITQNDNSILDQLSEAVESLTFDLQSVSDQNSNLNADYDQLKDDYDDLQSTNAEHSGLSADYDQLKDDYDDLQTELNTLSASYEQLLTDHETLIGSIPLEPELESTETIQREYSWSFDGREWTLSLNIPESIYNYYRDLQRAQTEDYSIYVSHPFDDEYLSTLIEKMNFIAISRDYSEQEKVNLVISFVQSLPYTSDSVTTSFDEYPRYPIETLIDNGGDCEDTSILVSALLHEMNYDVILLSYPGHMACAVYTQGVSGTYYDLDNRKYYYIETTGEGWEIGDIPEDYSGVSANYYRLTATPIITHTWEASWTNNKLEIDVIVSNEGTAKAEGLSVWVAFDAGEGYVWNQIESDPFDLQFGREVTIDLLLDLPQNEHTRLMIRIYDSDRYYITDSFSEWFDT
jgi:chaperonin cofactor prefoldin